MIRSAISSPMLRDTRSWKSAPEWCRTVSWQHSSCITGDGFVVNCAHPTHIAPALDDGAWLSRIVQVNPNASTLTHAELDAAEELDAGDLGLLTASYDELRAKLPGLAVIGGCCGTDARHVAALWGV